MIQLCVSRPRSPLRKSVTKEMLCKVLPFVQEGEFTSIGKGGTALDILYQGL